MKEKENPCKNCKEKNCKNCYHFGKDPSSMEYTDDYRKKVKKGYYSSSLIEVRDENGKFIEYRYNKNGE